MMVRGGFRVLCSKPCNLGKQQTEAAHHGFPCPFPTVRPSCEKALSVAKKAEAPASEVLIPEENENL